MHFTEINSRGKRGELLGRIDRQNFRFRTAKTIIIKFGLHASFVELESAKNAVNENKKDSNIRLGIAADITCTPIGPPPLKSRPPLQAQVSNITNIRVPDRGLKAAGAA
ncbi:uncharacterized protein TNCV_336451 [Trichonephila clavipes]|nr:uncharacterized protein TNCV_336451 [Trichonephila clavipes]